MILFASLSITRKSSWREAFQDGDQAKDKQVGGRGRGKVERVFLLVVDFVNKRRNNKQKRVQEPVDGWMHSSSEDGLAPKYGLSGALNLIRRHAPSKPWLSAFVTDSVLMEYL